MRKKAIKELEEVVARYDFHISKLENQLATEKAHRAALFELLESEKKVTANFNSVAAGAASLAGDPKVATDIIDASQFVVCNPGNYRFS